MIQTLLLTATIIGMLGLILSIFYNYGVLWGSVTTIVSILLLIPLIFPKYTYSKIKSIRTFFAGLKRI